MRLTKYTVLLTESERARLRTRVGRGVSPTQLLTRARVLLKADQSEGGAAGRRRVCRGARTPSHDGCADSTAVRGGGIGRHLGAESTGPGQCAHPRWDS